MSRPNPLKIDRTRTRTKQNAMAMMLRGRWNALATDISNLIDGQDIFGLRIIENSAWRFNTKDEQVQQFMKWVESQMAGYFPPNVDQDAMLQQYVNETYAHGMSRAFDAVKKDAKLLAVPEFYAGTRAQFLQDSFFRPASLEIVKSLAGRVLTELQGVNSQMAVQMQRTLTDSLIQGKGPREIARELSGQVRGLSKKQSEKIARTEIVRAYNEGQLTSMENLGVEDLGVAVEWSDSGMGLTAKGNPSPCRLCAPLVGIVVKTKKARGMLPRHPFCMCSWIPAGFGIDEKGQKTTRDRINKSVARSLRAERPKEKSVKEARKKSTWSGKDVRI